MRAAKGVNVELGLSSVEYLDRERNSAQFQRHAKDLPDILAKGLEFVHDGGGTVSLFRQKRPWD